MKKIIVCLLTCLMLVSCKNFNATSSSFDSSKEIDIVFTAIDDASSIKEEIKEKTPNVTVVGCGDSINKVGYDYSAIGKNEFENGINAFYNFTKHTNNKYLACNLSYNGMIKDIFKNVDPYVVVDYGGVKVAYIGVTSPNIKNNLKEDLLMEDDGIVVNFYDEEKEVLYDTVQEAIDNVKEMGADYVILLSYLGTKENDSPYSSYDFINNLSNVDIVLDGNSNSIVNETIKDSDGKDVILCAFNLNYKNYGLIKIEKENVSITFE